MKKIFMLIVTLTMLVTALSVNAAKKETAEIEQVIRSTYAIYLNTQFKASVPGGESDTLGIEVFDYCTGKKEVYWQKSLPRDLVKRIGGYSDNEKTIYSQVIDAKYWGTVLFIEFDSQGIVTKTSIHERFNSWEGTDYSSDPIE